MEIWPIMGGETLEYGNKYGMMFTSLPYYGHIIIGTPGLLIKKQALETPKLGLRKFQYLLREKLPNDSW
jgi:hypothetical protein